MPYYDDHRLSPEAAAQRATLTRLVAEYEAVRCTRCAERRAAERALGLELARYGAPFRLGEWVWQWSHTLDSITRSRASVNPRPYKQHEHDPGIAARSARRRHDEGEVFGGWSLKGRAI